MANAADTGTQATDGAAPRGLAAINWKVVVIGGLAFYVTQFALSIVTGPLIHEGLLDETYRATESFWRPELAQDPPDMAALMPRWITTGLISSFLYAAIYSSLRWRIHGSHLARGIKFGLILLAVYGTFMAGWSGVFNLPDSLWAWWFAEGVLMWIASGAVMGVVAQKVARI